jgi:hypothetical protein
VAGEAGGIVDVELYDETLAMGFDGLHADAQFRSDLFVGMAFGNPNQNAAAQAAADAQAEPGQMSKADARALLDSVKNEEQRLPAAPVARNGNQSQPSDQPIKDW